MTITEIKAAISAKSNFTLSSLSMVRQYDSTTKEKTEWVSHWDNDHRVRVTMHQDIMNTLLGNPTFAGLALKCEQIPADGERAAYTRYVVITPKDIDATF